MAVVAVAAVAFAGPWQGGRGMGGWGAGSAYQRMYNPATVETLSGEVVGVNQFRPGPGMRAGIHLLVRNGREAVSVHLGPAWYIEKLDNPIHKGDRVEVKGSRVMFQDKTAIIAAEVKRGDALLLLRDAQGIPVWSGWRRAR
jgi:hypothetical protein